MPRTRLGRTPQGPPPGKTNRIRQVLVYATDHDGAAGLRLVQHVVALLRADGAFSPRLDTHAGSAKSAGYATPSGRSASRSTSGAAARSPPPTPA